MMVHDGAAGMGGKRLWHDAAPSSGGGTYKSKCTEAAPQAQTTRKVKCSEAAPPVQTTEARKRI
eukprot:scaffold63642_cov19-Tisochrysis_lutea.AAC.2